MSPTQRKPLIIDTDPGIDDAMAILMAFNSPEVEVIALTTIFGNVQTPLATINAIKLCHMAGQPQVLIGEGCETPLDSDEAVQVADFVHGDDGFGNVNLPDGQQGNMVGNAAQLIVDLVNAQPGQVSVLALGPLTNIAKALSIDPALGNKWAELVVLGGAFFVNGNVNPAAEANIWHDAKAADFVFAHANRVKVVGLDVTHSCHITEHQLKALVGKGRYGSFVESISRFYMQYHKQAYGGDFIYVHDPTAMACVLDPTLFKFVEGGICVAVEGATVGNTILEDTSRKWHGTNKWLERPRMQVAMEVDSSRLVQLVLERMGA